MKIEISNIPLGNICAFKDLQRRCRFFDPYEIYCVLFEKSLRRKARMGYPYQPFKCEQCVKANSIGIKVQP